MLTCYENFVDLSASISMKCHPEILLGFNKFDARMITVLISDYPDTHVFVEKLKILCTIMVRLEEVAHMCISSIRDEANGWHQSHKSRSKCCIGSAENVLHTDLFLGKNN